MLWHTSKTKKNSQEKDPRTVKRKRPGRGPEYHFGRELF